MRWEIVRIFEREVIPRLGEKLQIAVVGGGPYEPELLAVCTSQRDVTVHWFGIESDVADPYSWLDLNKDARIALEGTFDLVLNSQVIEHVWNVPQALDHLYALAKPGGLVWIACPASNFSHGSPDYYSAGYTYEMLSSLSTEAGLVTLTGGNLGSQAYYRATHWYRVWLSEWDYEHPWRLNINRKLGTLRSLVYWFRKVNISIRLLGSSRQITTKVDWATEAFLLAEKVPSAY